MKKILFFALAVLLLQCIVSCNDDVPECFIKAGKDTSYDIPVEADFNTLHISEGIELVIRQGEEQKITVTTGENLKQYISAHVTDGTLYINNSLDCNWVRDYTTTTVYITTPHLETIYSASQFAVRSEGVLAFPSLKLQSGLFSDTASGTFELTIDADSLLIEDNQSAYYVISGNVNNCTVKFYEGDARFDGSGLVMQKLEVFHRSTNDIIAAPLQEVSGTLYSTGNLVLKNHPPVVNVERLYTGRVIYN